MKIFKLIKQIWLRIKNGETETVQIFPYSIYGSPVICTTITRYKKSGKRRRYDS